jgi:hypothetical protein
VFCPCPCVKSVLAIPASSRSSSTFVYKHSPLLLFNKSPSIFPTIFFNTPLTTKMRFTSIIAAGAFALLANAQSTTVVTTPSTTVSQPDPTQAAMLACLNKCSAGDVDCRAKCIAVPNPSMEQVSFRKTWTYTARVL